MGLRDTHIDEFLRLLRQPQHFLTMDNERYAPLRLLRELGEGKPFPVPENDPVPAKRLHAALAEQGWKTVLYGDIGFDTAFEAWSAYCVRFDANNTPRTWAGSDPRSGRSFTVPA
ncbi:hypothetical protein ACN2XU_05310 [Primorskyibacter sp. 2E107]|uniref:hypothetical protein n=1 Tax=Primorskyibacter sp. 2E107 TaxID=3403458 RepID=UPI003AF8FDEC